MRSMLSILRIGLDQTAHPSDGLEPAQVVDRALAQRLDTVEQAVRVGVQLLCFPELCCMPWFLGGPDPRWREQAWDADGPQIARLRRTAGLHRCVVVFPFLERGPDDLPYSSAAVVDADGGLAAIVRRQHVPLDQRSQIAPGQGETPMIETSVARLGVVLGHDLHQPELARILGVAGAELILFPAATSTDRPRNLWEAEPLAVASQNACWVGACNRVGRETLRGTGGARVLDWAGGSYIADSRGRFLARASRDQATLIRADLPLSRLRSERQRSPPHNLRRPEIYSKLVE
jgi:beta-ureidopropionase